MLEVVAYLWFGIFALVAACFAVNSALEDPLDQPVANLAPVWVLTSLLWPFSVILVAGGALAASLSASTSADTAA